MLHAALMPLVSRIESSPTARPQILDHRTGGNATPVEVPWSAQNSFSNTVTLDSLLDGAELRFRAAIIGALVLEGFELHEPQPYLQHPTDLLRAVARINLLDFGITWKSFHQDLLTAERFGILVDLSLQSAPSVQFASFLQSGTPSNRLL